VVVRRVEEPSYPDLLTIWDTRRAELAEASPARRKGGGDSVVAALARGDVVGYLAYHEDVPVGATLVVPRTVNPLTGALSVTVEQLYVAPAYRRLGVARQLLLAVASSAEAQEAGHVVSMVPGHLREANRFFARLGFTATVVRRVSTTAALRRRLTTEGGRLPALNGVLQRRRSARRRSTGAQQPVPR
jgi:GNAT superfamily N-acetyltransferase